MIGVHYASLTSQGVQHRVFYRDGHPSRYQPRPTGLIFGEQTGSGVFPLVIAVPRTSYHTLLYGVVVDDSDCGNLQDDHNKLEIWQHEWQMQFNPSKCNIICISNKQRPPQRTYFFCGSKFEQVDSASYLGITVNRKLKWSEHISSI